MADVRLKKVMAVQKLVGGQPPQPVPSSSYTFPAPIRGWVLNENLATAQPGGARRLENWLCTTTGIRVRGGSVKHATLPDPVTTLFTYTGGATAFFATTADAIYTATSPADPEVALTATISGLTSGDFATAQFGTAGGNFLYAINGSDSARLYDGSTWTAITGVSTPAITGVATADLSQVWSYANRLFFVEGGTKSAWYLPVDSIGGAATEFSLAGVFRQGGALLFGATWSLDSGDGLDDKCVFVSTEGEVAIYTGTNPGSAADWALQGVYRMPKPMGKNAYIQAGGDLLIATEVGMIPVSASIQSDLAAIESKAVSRTISPYWQQQARTIGGSWQMMKAQKRGVMFVSQPDATGADQTALAVNLLTGAWSLCTGWDAQCLGSFNDNPYFGALDGCIYLMDSSGSDAGTPYTAIYLGQADGIGVSGRQKTVRQMRAMFQTGSAINPQLTALANYREDVSSPPASPANYAVDEWDSGLWDTAIWDADAVIVNEANWTATGVTGSVIAPELQLTFGITPTPFVELVFIDAEFHTGAMVA
jgi:hypothetical protein